MELMTRFAPARRSTRKEIKLDIQMLDSEKLFLDAFGTMAGIAAVLNINRQIVYANEELLNLLEMKSLEPILGKRPGEAVACIHSSENINGCGTSEACSVCGAVNAILVSQQTGQKSTRETRITSVTGRRQLSWDLIVSSIPIKIKDRQYYVFTLQDISNEKQRQNLERIFFHDIMNSATGLNGLLQLLKDDMAPEKAREIIDLSEEACHDLIEEIMLQRQIKGAENGDLAVNIERISSIELLKSAVGRIEAHEVAFGKSIIVNDNSLGADIETDRTLFQRILINMLKNALEATEKGGTVYTGVHNPDDKVRFYVKNDLVMSKEIQLQVFQRSFSTKGTGRGLGTYSIKLLSENYLKGKVGFTSTESKGTVFFIDLFKIKNK